jgi:2-dehydropantoate 2-reductase
MINMKILILGAGAVGGYFGGRLVEHQQKQHPAANFEVTFLVRSGRAEQIRQNGLQLQNPAGDITTIRNVATIVSGESIQGSDSFFPEFDMIVLACKSYGLTGALDAIAPFVHAQVAILPLLNGMAHLNIIQERFPNAVVWGGTCGIVATLESDTGRIHRMTPSQFVKAGLLKRSSSSSSKAGITEFIQHLKDAGIEADASDNILETMWDKWTFLATAAASTCLMSASLGQILSTEYGQEFMLGVYHECNAVATADGGIQADLEGRQARYRHIFSDKNSIIKASMCRDMESGGPTEADHILGDMIRRATKHGIASPLLKTAYIKLQIHETQRLAKESTTS